MGTAGSLGAYLVWTARSRRRNTALRRKAVAANALPSIHGPGDHPAGVTTDGAREIRELRRKCRGGSRLKRRYQRRAKNLQSTFNVQRMFWLTSTSKRVYGRGMVGAGDVGGGWPGPIWPGPIWPGPI